MHKLCSPTRYSYAEMAAKFNVDIFYVQCKTRLVEIIKSLH